MLPTLLNARSVIVFFGVYAVFLPFSFLESLSASETTTTERLKHLWVAEAATLVRELTDLADDTPNVAIPESTDPVIRRAPLVANSRKLADNRDKSDELFWRLWLVTGKPPTIDEPKKTLREFLKESASSYQEYLAQHVNATEEEITRIALSNAVQSIGSSLWYMTLQFLDKKINSDLGSQFVVSTFPPRTIVLSPLQRDSYNRLSGALRDWINANSEQLDWNPEKKQFRARVGGYTENGKLLGVIENEFRMSLPVQGPPRLDHRRERL
jgi:hypothetical protein